jgi:phage terminase large subunit GpA-like protein
MWAEQHIESIPYSPMPGKFRIENSPQIREVLEAIVDPKVRQVCVMAAVQASKTLAGEIGLCYVIANEPGPTLWLNETDEDAKDQSESRLQKLFEVCLPVKSRFPGNPHKKRNQTIHFASGMTLWMLGAHNRTNLQRRSIRWIFADECWQFPPGHMAEAEARVTAFGWLGKCIWMSQGGEEQDDFHRKFETTDQREWTFECPYCQHRQAFLWENVEWAKDCKDENEQYDFARLRESTVLLCASCRVGIPDSDESRRRLNATGRFVVQNPKAAREYAGFHWNAIATMSWGQLAELYLRAKQAARKGDASLLQQFYQKRLGLPWREYVEDFKLDITRSGYRLGEPWADEGAVDATGRIIAPPFEVGAKLIPLRFLTVDCQMDHFFLVVRSWSVEGSSRLLWCERVVSWEDIDAVQKRFFVHSNLVFVDAGHAAYEVYRQCSERGWVALIGDRRATFVHKTKGGKPIQRFYSPSRKVVIAHGRSCFVHYWSNLNIKDSLARLRRNQDPANGVTWEVPDNVPEDYLAQMDSEHRVKEKGKWIWLQIGHRPNHLWDCECMQVAAATMLKIIGREAVQGSEDEEGE